MALLTCENKSWPSCYKVWRRNTSLLALTSKWWLAFFWRLSKVSCLLCDIPSSSTHALFTPWIIYLIHTELHTILSVTKNKLSWLRFNIWHVLPRRILLESFCQMWPVHTVIWKTIAFSRKTAAFNVIKSHFKFMHSLCDVGQVYLCWPQTAHSMYRFGHLCFLYI